MHVTKFVKEPNLRNSNPNGSWNSSLSEFGTSVYVASNGLVMGYNAQHLRKSPFLTLLVTGNVLRARTIFQEQRLVLVADRRVALYDNSDQRTPVLLASLNVTESSVIDFISFPNLPSGGTTTTILYVLCADGLRTVLCTLRSLQLSPAGTAVFAANLNAGLILESRNRALYINAITHGAIYVMDVRNPAAPILTETIVDRFYPVDGTQTSRFPNLLMTGGIFGISFYDVSDPLHPQLINQQESPYLNLVRLIPGTDLVVNGLFLPENQLVIGRIKWRRKKNHKKWKGRYTYETLPRVSLPLQFGRLPWNLTLVPVPPSTAKRVKAYSIVSTNSTESLVEVAFLKLS